MAVPSRGSRSHGDVLYCTPDMESKAKASIDFAPELDFDQILTNPILDIAARFWEPDRYQAFKVTYRSMRRIDDLVDNRKATGQKVTADEAAHYRSMITDWLASIRSHQSSDRLQTELIDTLQQYSIPTSPWERLCTAMIYDLTHDGFPSFTHFLHYTEGAAVAPASVFMHLIGVRQGPSSCQRPPYDIHTTARPLAIFSYLVHIMRDFQKDQAANLNYFPTAMLQSYGLEPESLRAMALSGHPDSALRKLFSEYRQLAEKYRRRSRLMIDSMTGVIPQRYRLSLEIIYELYLQIFERIDPEAGSFTAEELQPDPDKIRERIDRTVASFDSAKN